MNAVSIIESLPQQNIPLSALQPSKHNVRKTGGVSIDQLAASIGEEGLLQNLVVTPTAAGAFEVIAGNRRLRALQKLAKEGRWGADQVVPCSIKPLASATTSSLAENAIREAMHPLDQADAFRQLIEEGHQSEDDVAARFGVVVTYVRQRLQLAKISPKIRAAFLDGKLTLAKAEAFACVNDHDRQEKVFKSLQRWQSEEDIRDSMKHGEVRLTDRRVKLVGLDAYKAAGGPIREDLFGKTEDASIADVKLLDQLVASKFGMKKNELLAEGWYWVEAGPDIEEYRYQRALKPDKKKHGALVTLGHGGKLVVTLGVLRAGQTEKGATKAGSSSSRKKAKPKKPGELSFAQRQMLQAERTSVLRLHLANSPRVAMAGLAAALLHELFKTDHMTNHRSSDEVVRIEQRDKYQDRVPLPLREVFDKHPAQKALSLQISEFKKRAGKDVFAWLLEQPEAVTHEALALAAGAAALTVQIFDGPDNAAEFCALANLPMADWWQVTPEWLNKQPTAYLVAAVTEYRGKAAGELVQRAKGKAGVVAAAAQQLRGWMPGPLRGLDYEKVAKLPAITAVGDVCKHCGCDDMNACPGGCSWAAPGVCSKCVGNDIAAVAGKRAPKKVAKPAKTAGGALKRGSAAERKKAKPKPKPIAKTRANSKAGKLAARRAANKAKKR